MQDAFLSFFDSVPARRSFYPLLDEGSALSIQGCALASSTESGRADDMSKYSLHVLIFIGRDIGHQARLYLRKSRQNFKTWIAIQRGQETKRTEKKGDFGAKEAEYICQDCAQIDLEVTFKLSLELSFPDQGLTIASLGARCIPPVANLCALCNIFSAAIHPGFLAAGRDAFDLRVTTFHSLEQEVFPNIMTWESHFSDQYCLVVVPTGSPFTRSDRALMCFKAQKVPDRMFALRKVPLQCDLVHIKNLIKYCAKHHQELCNTPRPRPQALKLIDCHSLSIVIASPSDRYVALSYVWASTAPLELNSSVLSKEPSNSSSDPPNLIRDAISVTRALGYRYLWVDQICINQNDSVEKHDQINQMDLVYQNSEITIIAASQNEGSGLPGINATPRKSQPKIRVGGISIVSTMGDPRDFIHQTRWSTRGWTYQEAILSRRRLVFTEEQMYFECNAMNCRESLTTDLDMIHEADRSKKQGWCHPGIFSAQSWGEVLPLNLEYKEIEAPFIQIHHHIEDYSTKDLSFDTDILNAFTGILKRFQRDEGMLHIWGVPFFNPKVKDIKQSRNSFAASLLWEEPNPEEKNSDASDDNSESSANKKKKKRERRPWIPSWSWASYTNGVSIIDNLITNGGGYESFTSLLSGVYLESSLNPGALVEKEESFTNTNTSPEDLDSYFFPTSLHLQGFITSDPSPINMISWTPYEGWHIAGFTTYIYFSNSSHLSREEELEYFQTGKCRFLVLGEQEFAAELTYLMIIEEKGDVVERVGVMLVYATFEELRERLEVAEERVRMG